METMTQDSGSERPQRTVAELLAEYGGSTGDAPRRRRRRAEDDGDSAPQTIIERVLSDSGKLLPIRDDQPAAPPRRAGGHRTGEHRPAAPQQQAPPQQKPPQQKPPQQAPPPPPQAAPQQPPTAYAEPVRPQGPPARRPQQQPVQKPPAQQQPPQPPPQQQPQFPPSRPGVPPAGQQTAAARPVQGPPPGTQSARPVQPPTGRNPTLAPRPQVGQRPRVDDEAATAVHPPLPDFAPAPQDRQQPAAAQPTMQAPPVQQPQAAMPQPLMPQPPTAGRPGALPPEATTEEFPLVPADPQAPPTRRHPPAQQPPAAMESTQAHAGPYVDDDVDEDFQDDFTGPDFAPGGASRTDDDEAFRGRDEYDHRDYGEDFADEDDEPSSGGREWLLMAVQVAVGAVAGAAVWLAFSWLWGFQSVVAIVLAVLVIIGLVFGVRRWRRADDMQTTVLAVVAGLVVTVSPAALLLLHR